MTDKQPAKAILLAEELSYFPHDTDHVHSAAAELRRIYAMNEELVDALHSIANGDARSTKKMDKCIHGLYGYENCESCLMEFAQAAIAKAGEQP